MMKCRNSNLLLTATWGALCALATGPGSPLLIAGEVPTPSAAVTPKHAAVAKPKTEADRDANTVDKVIFADKGSAQSEEAAQTDSEQRENDRRDPLKRYGDYLDTQRMSETYAAAAMWFFRKHPNDPRRWGFIVQMGYIAPLFITGTSDKFQTDPSEGNLIVDTKAVEIFKARQRTLLAQLDASSDADKDARRGAIGWLVVDAKNDARKQPSASRREVVHALVERTIKRYPNDPVTTHVIETYQKLLDEQVPEEGKAYAAQISARKIPAVMTAEKDRLAQLGLVSQFSDFKFTALDGRLVDISQFRGKVVLLDFWATWCGPCIAEMPNVKQVYADWHTKGFEVIGVTVDEEKDRNKVIKFVSQRNIPWPQYFDGKGFDSKTKDGIAAKFNIGRIPATFLLDQSGKVASSDDTGPKLVAEVKRLLGS